MSDPASKIRVTTADALGRITEVIEDPGTFPAQLNYTTSYAYDLLDNLTGVTQGSQPRSFTYDSLGRLVKATNPESGSVCYGHYSGSDCVPEYDGNGNVLKKTDALNVVTTFVYDALNRVTHKSYSDTTASVTYTYDTDQAIPNHTEQNHPAGRLVRVDNGTSAAVYRYDAAGRSQSSMQTTGGQNYVFGYSYKPACRVGHLTFRPRGLLRL